MTINYHASLLMRMALGEFREYGETGVFVMPLCVQKEVSDIPLPVPSRQYHNRITVWRDRSDSTRVMRQLAAKGWAREQPQESTEKQITYAITPAGVRALVEQVEA